MKEEEVGLKRVWH